MKKSKNKTAPAQERKGMNKSHLSSEVGKFTKLFESPRNRRKLSIIFDILIHSRQLTSRAYLTAHFELNKPKFKILLLTSLLQTC